MQRIISLSVILHYTHYFHPNLKNRRDTRSCVVVIVLYLTKVYIHQYYNGVIKDLVMMETIISNFHTSLYIPDIQKLEFHIPHVQILGTNNCGDSLQTAFKRRKTIKKCISAKMLKTEGLGKKQICIYETYKNTVMPHGRHIYVKAYNMAKTTICVYSQ